MLYFMHEHVNDYKPFGAASEIWHLNLHSPKTPRHPPRCADTLHHLLGLHGGPMWPAEASRTHADGQWAGRGLKNSGEETWSQRTQRRAASGGPRTHSWAQRGPRAGQEARRQRTGASEASSARRRREAPWGAGPVRQGLWLVWVAIGSERTRHRKAVGCRVDTRLAQSMSAGLRTNTMGSGMAFKRNHYE